MLSRNNNFRPRQASDDQMESDTDDTRFIRIVNHEVN